MKTLNDLNEAQKEAVKHKDGALLILAGAGSGKTRVITRRIAYLIEEYGINKSNILALTFTNKAANEMKNRVRDLLGGDNEEITISTFHSLCNSMLKKYIHRIGYKNKFTIYDTEDSKRLISDIVDYLNLDKKKFRKNILQRLISKFKNTRKPELDGDYLSIYNEYEKRLKESNALDFDDLLIKTLELLKTDVAVLEYYRKKYRYILVDEYQDTNIIQFEILSLLTNYEDENGVIYDNICVVGDDDQSIYSFRGADINNILDFEKVYKNTRIIKLETNYRSTKKILETANSLIANNRYRKEKTLNSYKNSDGKVFYKECINVVDEAFFIVSEIKKLLLQNKINSLSEVAILYRNNRQSRTIEEQLVSSNLPYKIYGGINFYSRKEIKDIRAYLNLINNTDDDVSLGRILNIPKRGVGKTSEIRLRELATERKISLYEALKSSKNIVKSKKAQLEIEKFIQLIEEKKEEFSKTNSLISSIKGLIKDLGYIENEGDEETEENIEEFYRKIIDFEKNDYDPNQNILENFLENIALLSDVEKDDSVEKVSLMTIHQSKGLEYNIVFICGINEWKDDDFKDDKKIEEERRVFYVGVTRAMSMLYLSSYTDESIFIDEIIEVVDKYTSDKEKNKEDIKITDNKKSNYSLSYITERYNIKKGFGSQENISDVGLSVGDIVRHRKFGTGKIIEIDTEKDFVAVDFVAANYGIKRLRLTVSGLKKV